MKNSSVTIKTILRLLFLVVLLNVVRYVVGWPIEGFTIMEPMHRVMPLYPEVFDNEFSNTDFAMSFIYNFVMWFVATWIFHLLHPALKGSMLVKSLKSFGLVCLFFVSLAAVYMNHYTASIKSFYIYSMFDALIVFSIVAVANAVLYPRIFKSDS